jgi:hypothetical protein|tara:strand:+ start:1782 stop:2273 length:492 start_codon:yes stop_codon:yes gene_type:complete
MTNNNQNLNNKEIEMAIESNKEVFEILFNIKEQILELELALYEAGETDGFTPPAPGDYQHPETPTHEMPVELEGTSSYWSAVTQTWLSPTHEDTHDVFYNADTNMEWLPGEGWTSTGESDWSNNFVPRAGWDEAKYLELANNPEYVFQEGAEETTPNVDLDIQ